MEKALRHILEVYRQVRRFGFSRIDASKMVAKKHRVSQQTVMSSCTRDAGIKNTAEFDYLLEPENTPELRSLLVKRYPTYQRDINQFFNAFGEPDVPYDSAQAKLETLFDDERKSLFNEIMIEVFKDTFMEWKNRKDIPSDVRRQVQIWLDKIGK